MTKLERLIQELCPNGVEHVQLGSIVTFINGRAYKQNELLDQGKYRVLRVGNFFTSNKWYYSDLELEKDKYCIKGDLLYAWAASLGPKVWDGDKTIFHYHIWKLDFDETSIHKRYLYHFLLKDIDDINNSLTHSTMPHVSMANMKNRMIPLPPLEVQDEIVRILDNFTELTAGLTAELTARKKQYDYYKERVFESFIRDDTQYIPINKFAIVKDGTHDSPKQKQEGKYLITSKNIKNGKVNFNGAYLISIEDYNSINQRSKVDKWDLLFTTIGTVGEVGIVFDEPDYAIKNVGLIKTNNETASRFLYHFLTSKSVKKYVADNKSKGSQVFLALGKLRNIPIPVFTFSEQQQIVEILDRFDKLCNDISEGLPAEIEARQKQYEYYRDKLLTFKEVE